MALWTPSQITTEAWFDASDSGTITESSGSVSQWGDKSGNDNHATQVVSASQPIYNGVNNTIDFDGTDDFLNLGDKLDLGTNDMSVFVVGSNNSDTGYGFLAKARAGTIVGRWYFGYNVDTNTMDIFSQISSGNKVASISHSSTDVQMFLGTIDRDTELEVWVNAVSQNTQAINDTTDHNTTDLCLIGAYADSVGGLPPIAWSDITLKEIVFVKSILSETDRQKLEGYFAWKWGLEGQLPVGHPYKSAAPTTPSGITIDHTAGTLNMPVTTHTVTAIASVPINIEHSAGTLNMPSTTHSVSVGNNIDIQHEAGILNMPSTNHNISIGNNIDITHIAGTLNIPSINHNIEVSNNINIEHIAGTLSFQTTEHEISILGDVIINHEAGTLNFPISYSSIQGSVTSVFVAGQQNIISKLVNNSKVISEIGFKN